MDFHTATLVAQAASHFALQYCDSSGYFTACQSAEHDLDAGIHLRTFLDAGVQMFLKSASPP